MLRVSICDRPTLQPLRSKGSIACGAALADLVPAAGKAESHRGQVPEHVLADGAKGGLGLVVGLVAVDVAEAVGGLAVDRIDAEAVLLAGLLVRRSPA